MLSPFPGMDPYLDHSELWPEVHHRLITALANAIAPPIRPKYRVAIEKRTYLTQLIEVKEGYLEIREVGTGKVVTVVEILSPTNKRAGKGRSDYETKREQVLSSSTHLVEIDLLRGGK